MPHLNKQGEKCEECGHETCPYCNLGCHNTDCNRHMRPIDKCYNAFLISSSNTNREWEERFDEKFGTFILGSGKGHTIATEHNIKSFIQEELTRERERIIQSIWLGISQTSGARTYRSVEIIDFIKDYAYEEGIELIPKEE